MMSVHGRMLEFFWVKHSDDEVADEQKGNDAGEDSFHGVREL